MHCGTVGHMHIEEVYSQDSKPPSYELESTSRDQGTYWKLRLMPNSSHVVNVKLGRGNELTELELRPLEPEELVESPRAFITAATDGGGTGVRGDTFFITKRPALDTPY